MRDESGTASSPRFNATPFSFSPPQITPLQRIKPLKHEQKKKGGIVKYFSLLIFLRHFKVIPERGKHMILVHSTFMPGKNY